MSSQAYAAWATLVISSRMWEERLTMLASSRRESPSRIRRVRVSRAKRSRAPPNRFRLFRAFGAIPRSFPCSRVKRVAMTSASRYSMTLSTTASTLLLRMAYASPIDVILARDPQLLDERLEVGTKHPGLLGGPGDVAVVPFQGCDDESLLHLLQSLLPDQALGLL